jgi:murein DD-endopeptidase MepM/ murein hydrolase activator NlpD
MRFPRIARVAVASLAVVLVSSLVSPTAQAGTDPKHRKKQVDSSITRLQSDLEDTSAELSAAYLRLKAVQAKLPGAQAELVTAQNRLDAARERDRQLAQQLKVAQAQEGKATDDLAATAASTRDTTATLGTIARQAYQTGGVGELSVALQAQSADDFAQRVAFVDTAMQLQGQALAQLQVDRAQTAAKRARLTAVRQQVALLKAQAAANVVKARQLEQAAAAAKARVESLIKQQAAEVHTIEGRKAAEKKRLDALQAEQRKLQRQLAAIARAERLAAARAAARARASRQHRSTSSPPSSGSSSSSGSFLSRPVNGAWISSEFGMRFHPILHYWRLHAGMDFAVACGTPVHAAASGRIISAGWGGGYGNRIVVGHGIERGVSLATTYNHLSRIVVSGGSVRRGELIGYSGTTGSSTGCHLHFETYENGTPVNPRRWLNP